MLNIYYGYLDESYDNPSSYFDGVFEPEWLESDLAKEMILDIDKSVVQSGYCILSPVLGQIPPQMLSGGVKTLILMLNESDKIFNATACGDNCAKWILKIAEQQDLTITLEYFMDFRPGLSQDGLHTNFNTDVIILNNRQRVKNTFELLKPALDFLREV